jgi:hypothetical protein
MEEELVSKREAGIFLRSTALETFITDLTAPSDEAVRESYENQFVNEQSRSSRAAKTSLLKESIMQKYYDNYIRYSLRSDNDFTFPLGHAVSSGSKDDSS